MAMAEAPARPSTTQAAAPPAKHVDPPPAMNQLSLEDGRKAVAPHESNALAVVDSPAKEMELSRSTPQTPPETPEKTKISPGKRGSNLKAEAFAVAHSKRVEHEAQAYIDAEVRKGEAAAEKRKALAEKERMREEAKATEQLKKEEQRAELVVHEAVIKADKIVAQANEKAAIIKATAKETAEKHIAEAYTECERGKAGAEETKSKRMAEIKDTAETMIAAGELITPPTQKASFGKCVPCISGGN